jgi:hypothetical protein
MNPPYKCLIQFMMSVFSLLSLFRVNLAPHRESGSILPWDGGKGKQTQACIECYWSRDVTQIVLGDSKTKKVRKVGIIQMGYSA